MERRANKCRITIIYHQNEESAEGFIDCSHYVGSSRGFAQDAVPSIVNDTIYNPDIIYSPIPKVYEIAGIRVEGINHVDDYLIIAHSGLSVGEKVEVPGSALTNATKRLWRQGLYSKVQISAEKAHGNKIWLVISLRQQPRMSEMRFNGVKGGEKKDITDRLSMVPGQQITPNIVRAPLRSSRIIMARKVSRMPMSQSIRCLISRRRTRCILM